MGESTPADATPSAPGHVPRNPIPRDPPPPPGYVDPLEASATLEDLAVDTQGEAVTLAERAAERPRTLF